MTTLGVWLTIATTVIGGLFLGVLLSWIARPHWITPVRLAAILIIAVTTDVIVVFIQQTVPVATVAGDQDAAAASKTGLVPSAQIDPGQASRAILTISGLATGKPRLVESNLAGNVHRTVGPGPTDGEFAVFDGSELVTAGYDVNPMAAGLATATTSGHVKYVLTTPPANVMDTDPAVTSAGQVYFLRTRWSPQSGVVISTTLMEMPVSGNHAPVQIGITTDPPMYAALSVNEKGTLLAAQCAPPQDGGATEACVYDLPSGHLALVTDYGSSEPVFDVAISPNGRYLAYGDAAANPYGGIQIYVRDLTTGTTIRVSSEPGNSQQPSWVPGPTPCVLYSNMQTSGDVVYLSCATPRPRTSLVSFGDYPTWLGVLIPATVLPKAAIDWRALWDTFGSPVMLALSFIVSSVIGLFVGWVNRPRWVTRPRLVCMISGLVMLQIAGSLTIPRLFEGPPSGLTTVALLDPTQAGGTLLVEPSTTQDGQVVGLRLNGTNVEPLQIYAGTAALIPVGGTADRFVFNDAGTTDAEIELIDSSGNEIRVLSMPPLGSTDTSPALATKTGEVFFEQEAIIPEGHDASTVGNPTVMEVSLDGGGLQHLSLNPPPLNGPLSVDATGTELAARCGRGNQIYACVYELPHGQTRYETVPRTGIEALALSPDGQFLAYGGGTSLYAYSFRLHTTYTVSSLPGFNEQPDWLQGGSKPCLLFANLQTTVSQVYLVCLSPRVSWAPVTQGAYPEWLGG